MSTNSLHMSAIAFASKYIHTSTESCAAKFQFSNELVIIHNECFIIKWEYLVRLKGRTLRLYGNVAGFYVVDMIKGEDHLKNFDM